MIESNVMLSGHTRRLAAIAIVAATVIAAPAFACPNPSFAGPRAARLPADAPPALIEETAAGIASDFLLANEDSSAGSIVGMWHTILRLGDANGPVYDEVLEQFHSDGTELLISSGLPPALGNVCIGVWKRVAARTYKLRHMTWNWSPPDGGFGVPGTFAGHFELEVTLTLDSRGRAFDGQWSAKNFDPSGEHIPDLDADGPIRGVRLTVD